MPYCVFTKTLYSSFPAAGVSDGGQLPDVRPAAGAGEREELEQGVGGRDQGGAAGALPAEQRPGETYNEDADRSVLSQ